MKYQLVLQFEASNIDEFDQLVELEDSFENVLGESHEVDGHDFGSGEMNIFIHTNEPKEAFEIIKNKLIPTMGKDFTAAFRELSGENYTVLWPEGFSGGFRVVQA